MAEKKITEADLLTLLRDRFKAPEFAFLAHVRNGTGYQRTTRTADAIAMGLWPSRGLHLHGFEVKVSRGDWLREKDLPEKAEEIARFCNCWWLVVGDKEIVQPGELPATWGLLAPRGSKLVAIKEAPVREALPPSHLFLAAILRRATEAFAERVDPAEVEAEVSKRIGREKAAWEADAKWERSRTAAELERLKGTVAAFEQASGVTIDRWSSGHVGAAVKLVLAGHDTERIRRDLEHYAANCESAARTIRDVIGGSDAA